MKHQTVALVALVAACASAFAAPPAGRIAYMSSSLGEPWRSTSNVDAMNAAFGAGNWDHINFTDGYSGYAFVYIDGSDSRGFEFQAFVTTNRTDLENYVNWGGRLFMNAASNGLDRVTYSVGFGATTMEADTGYSNAGALTAAGMPLSAHGAGTSWTGTWFAHNEITSGMTVMITGDAGEAVLVGGSWGDGYVMIGGQTSTDFHTGVNGSNPFRLRVNELTFAASAAAVPEPETCALMLAGLGTVGMLVRRRQRAA